MGGGSAEEDIIDSSCHALGAGQTIIRQPFEVNLKGKFTQKWNFVSC